MIRYSCYSSPVGNLLIGHDGTYIYQIRLTDRFDAVSDSSPVSDSAAWQLDQYFRGQLREFDLPLAPQGTAFQRSVWDALLRIPYGQSRTYGQIARELGKPGAARAVGMACNRNPIWFVIPCHRVVGSDQALTGYAGGIALKQSLLNLEKQNPGT